MVTVQLVYDIGPKLKSIIGQPKSIKYLDIRNLHIFIEILAIKFKIKTKLIQNQYLLLCVTLLCNYITLQNINCNYKDYIS